MGCSKSALVIKKLLIYLFTSFLLIACGGSGDSDKTPNAFSFAPLTNVARDVQLESEIVTISGIDTDILVSISGGEYSIDGSEFTSSVSKIVNNQTLQLRIQTPVGFAESKTVTITLGSLNVSLLVQTFAAPHMTSLDLVSGSEIKAGESLVVSTICDHCNPESTRYEWQVGGVEQVVSTEDSYQVPAEYVSKEISITAIPVNIAGDEGSSITRIYALNRVKEIIGNELAFTALKYDGTVDSWGNYSHGGGWSSVTAPMTEIQQVSAIDNWGEGAFVAIKTDGSVVGWGSTWEGDTFSEVTDPLKEVKAVSGANGKFAAIKADGTVVVWGYPSNVFGSGIEIDYDVIKSQLTSVESISVTGSAFAAIKADGSVVAWGDVAFGAYISSVIADQLTQVKSISASDRAFAAIRANGSVVTWGDSDYGGDSSVVTGQLTQVQSISATFGAFAAIRADGTVITWGSSYYGGDSSTVADQLIQVESISATHGAFAAIRTDGSVVTWGHTSYGSDRNEVANQLTQVQSISASEKAFAAIRADGSVVTWGDSAYGGDSSVVADQLIQVLSISATSNAFAAIKADASVVTWGDPAGGGFAQNRNWLEPSGIVTLK